MYVVAQLCPASSSSLAPFQVTPSLNTRRAISETHLRMLLPAHQLQLLDLQKHLHLVAFHPQVLSTPTLLHIETKHTPKKALSVHFVPRMQFLLFVFALHQDPFLLYRRKNVSFSISLCSCYACPVLT